jgi:thioredoxin 1
MHENSSFLKITDENFNREVLESDIPVLVEITAYWCGCCHIMKPIIEKLAEELKEKLKIGVVDIDTNEKVAKEYGLSELPIILLFRNGELVDHLIGLISKNEFLKRIKSQLV